LLKLKNNLVEIKYDYTNNPFSPALPDHSVRMFALDFDNDMNLWVTQGFSNDALFQLNTANQWSTHSLSSIYSNFEPHGFMEIAIDKNNNIWLGTEKKGVIGYNPSNGKIALISNIKPTGYPHISALAVDKNNTLWMGNLESLLILPNPERAFSDPDIEFKPIKIVYEGSVQLLLEGQDISCIKVDGSNNKWVGTLGSGLYYFNEDGTQTIYHFTKENSPLPSNDISDITIDGKTGIVYVASSAGLLGFKGNATDSSENMDDVYAFPNPVNLKKHNFVTIRGLMEGVNIKIVDVEGNLVYETNSKGGSIDWDLTAFGRYKVASGVYIALITNEDGSNTQTTKILVIK
jgi:hypothetical protein